MRGFIVDGLLRLSSVFVTLSEICKNAALEVWRRRKRSAR